MGSGTGVNGVILNATRKERFWLQVRGAEALLVYSGGALKRLHLGVTSADACGGRRVLH